MTGSLALTVAQPHLTTSHGPIRGTASVQRRRCFVQVRNADFPGQLQADNAPGISAHGQIRPNQAVYHDLTDEHREHMKSQGTDPADYVDADDLARLLSDEFTIELHAVEPRIDPPPDNPHVADVVLRARRR